MVACAVNHGPAGAKRPGQRCRCVRVIQCECLMSRLFQTRAATRQIGRAFPNTASSAQGKSARLSAGSLSLRACDSEGEGFRAATAADNDLISKVWFAAAPFLLKSSHTPILTNKRIHTDGQAGEHEPLVFGPQQLCRCTR